MRLSQVDPILEPKQKKRYFIIYIEEDLFFGYYLTHEMCRAKRKNQKKNNFLILLCSSFLRSGGNLLCPVSNRLKAKNLIIVLIPDCKKRPYVLKQTCSSKLQLCLSMCDFSVTTIHWKDDNNFPKYVFGNFIQMIRYLSFRFDSSLLILMHGMLV